MALTKIDYSNVATGHTVDCRFDNPDGYTKVFHRFNTQKEAFAFIYGMMTKDEDYDPVG